MTVLCAHRSGVHEAIAAQDTGQISRQFAARDFRVQAEDLELTLADGSVFPVDTAGGVAALVLLGRGVMRFSPAPESEKTQVRVFSGAAALESRFDAAFVWFGRLDGHADLSRLAARAVDTRERQRAEEVLSEEARKTLVIEPGASTIPRISRLPDASDFIAEVRTRRFGALTYLRSEATPENITLFERSTQKTIALYHSRDRLAARGRFYKEDDSADYDVLHHNLDFSYSPERRWIDGRADMRLRTRLEVTDRIPLRLSESLTIRSVTSPEAGRLSATRVGTRDAVMVGFPTPLQRNTELTVSIEYSGRVDPFFPEWEMPRPPMKPSAIAIQPAYLNTMFPIWYPRPPIIDFATVRMRVTVPAAFDCMGSGELTGNLPTVTAADPSQPTKTFEFVARQPLRHAAFLVTPLTRVDRQTLTFRDQSADASRSVELTVLAHPGRVSEARPFAASVANIVTFFQSIVGGFPFPTLTAALLEGQIPGGHSVGYSSVVGWPPKNTSRSWRNDPAAFDLFPDFITAHEIAHQWWGQATGWNVYHDQWMTEAFTQYFAALYVGRQAGDEVFRAILKRMRTFAMAETDEGPLSLGYRLGTLDGRSEVFRAILYDKGPAVLHMLRRFIGDEAFFRGVRRFYEVGRFAKPGTDDLRRAMEAESGRSLERFFERWVYGSSLPQLRFSYRVEPEQNGSRDVVLRFDQTGELFDVPVTLVLQYSDKPQVEVIVPVTARTTEKRVALAGALRRVEVVADDTLAEVRR
jgi:aminopeptidase N